MQLEIVFPGRTAGRCPACLVMLYEVFGMSGEMRRRPGEAAVLRGRALDDLEAAGAWSAAGPQVDGERLAAIGFCMGGS